MSKIFADTFFWIALTNVLGEGHRRANALLQAATAGQLVTTQEVLTEYLNYFSGFKNRSRATLLALNILQNPVVHVLAQSPDSFQSGFNLYRAQGLQPYRLHLDGYDAPRGNCRSVDE